jgi:type I restriction-modification system DNA methylase subunit
VTAALTSLLWSAADLLRGDFKQVEYYRVLLPFTFLRRLECLAGPQQPSILASVQGANSFLADVTDLVDDMAVFRSLEFEQVVRRLDDARLLPVFAARFAAIDLTRAAVPDEDMGDVFSDLVRHGTDLFTHMAGEFSTPPDVAALVAGLLFAPDAERLSRQVTRVRLYDPACGTGGTLTAASDVLRGVTRLDAFGQDINAHSYALSRMNLVMRGIDARGVVRGDTLTDDRHAGETFDYLVAHPPFALHWTRAAKQIREEAAQGAAGRFGAGLPRTSDASLLFLQHLVAHMRPAEQGGSRAAVVFSSGPLFAGAAGSGESEIRRWVIERDLLETVVALPDQLFPNTGIGTYVWILSNRKESSRQGNVVLLDCRQRFATTRGKLDDKRKYITPEQIADITSTYRATVDGRPPSGGPATVIPAAELGYQRVTVDRPRRGGGAQPEADPHLRSFHELPLNRDVNLFLAEEIRPRTPDAWIDPDAIKIGYEIRPYHFFAIPLGVENVPLGEVVEFVSRAKRPDPDSPLLTLKHLGAASSVTDLPRLGDSERRSPAGLTPCADGDIVGRPGLWRVLPAAFGDAVTPLTVLRPVKGAARAIQEWLESAQNADVAAHGRLRDIPVPLPLIGDLHVDDWLDDVQQTRADLSRVVSTLMPNIFDDLRGDFPRLRRNLAATTSRARLVSELVRPLSDPVWSAEWAYPFPVATLARQYRIATSLPQRKEALLKLGESIARTLGVLALAVLAERNGGVLSGSLRARFSRGATFGTWTSLIHALVQQGPVPELNEFDDLLVNGGPYELLLRIQRARNSSGHAYGVRADHEIEEEIAGIEPVVVAALESVSWLAQLQFDLVDRCEYTGSAFRLIGRRLRGSHPEWEPFERVLQEPVTPGQVYVNNLTSTRTIRLAPVAKTQLCLDCRQWELFILNDVHDDIAMFRSGRDHEIEQALT